MTDYTDYAEYGVELNARDRCDHICLLDDEHVHRGVGHQYGYELPSPRRDLNEYSTEQLIAELVRREALTWRFRWNGSTNRKRLVGTWEPR